MVVQFSRQEKILIFKTVSETYYRYGTQRLLNWHAVTNERVYLSYFSTEKEEATIVEYDRKVSTKNEFYEGVTVKLSQDLLKYHEAYVTNNHKLLVSHLSSLPAMGSLMSFNLKDNYYLLLNYSHPGQF